MGQFSLCSYDFGPYWGFFSIKLEILQWIEGTNLLLIFQGVFFFPIVVPFMVFFNFIALIQILEQLLTKLLIAVEFLAVHAFYNS